MPETNHTNNLTLQLTINRAFSMSCGETTICDEVQIASVGSQGHSSKSVGSGLFRGMVAVWLGSLSLMLISCAQTEEQKQEEKYHVILEHQLHAGMQTMADHLNRIAGLGFEDSLSEEDKTSIVLNELEAIRALANDIASPGEITNYSVINRYMDAFIYDVQVAEQFSRRTPPNHFPAYTLVKSCLSCHDSV